MAYIKNRPVGDKVTLSFGKIKQAIIMDKSPYPEQRRAYSRTMELIQPVGVSILLWWSKRLIQ